MFDWDGDGKKDWHDDALFHTVINKTDSEKNTNTTNSSGGGCVSWVVGALIFLWIISKLIG